MSWQSEGMTNPALLKGDESSAVAGTVALLAVETLEQLVGLVNRVERCVNSAEENLGHMEEELLREGHEVMRQLLEKAAQAKAAAVPPRCPECQQALGCLSGGHGTTIQTRFGEIRVERVRGKCRRCQRWRFPADAFWACPPKGRNRPRCRKSPR